jgi:hypothetical protein
MHLKYYLSLLVIVAANNLSAQQVLLMTDAVYNSVNNYQGIQAKKNYYNSSKELVANTKNEYLPNIIAGFQNAYGTVNAQYGALGPGAVIGVSTSGPVYSSEFGMRLLPHSTW